jgi:hypothetical protein
MFLAAAITFEPVGEIGKVFSLFGDAKPVRAIPEEDGVECPDLNQVDEHRSEIVQFQIHKVLEVPFIDHGARIPLDSLCNPLLQPRNLNLPRRAFDLQMLELFEPHGRHFPQIV